MLTWDTLPGGGFVWGLPLAVAAIVIGGAMVAIMAVWTVTASL
jgi:hypothetical protein